VNPHDIIARCDEGLAKLRADQSAGGAAARGVENRIAAIEKTRADAVAKLERAERARRGDPWRNT
jgi:hypothetical protein